MKEREKWFWVPLSSICAFSLS